jgi:predicted nucleotidyltransferase
MSAGAGNSFWISAPARCGREQLGRRVGARDADDVVGLAPADHVDVGDRRHEEARARADRGLGVAHAEHRARADQQLLVARERGEVRQRVRRGQRDLDDPEPPRDRGLEGRRHRVGVLGPQDRRAALALERGEDLGAVHAHTLFARGHLMQEAEPNRCSRPGRMDTDARRRPRETARARRLCRRFHVRKLELFGSATTDRFDPTRSDVDFFVDFDAPPDGRLGRQYLDFLAALEALFGRGRRLGRVVGRLEPIFLEVAAKTRQTVYAA